MWRTVEDLEMEGLKKGDSSGSATSKDVQLHVSQSTVMFADREESS